MLQIHTWFIRLREGHLATEAEREVALVLERSGDPKAKAPPFSQVRH